MIPVTQTRTGERGTCMSACVASILELPAEDVPYFGDTNLEFFSNIARFLEPFGLYYVQIKRNDPLMLLMFRAGDVWHTIEGTSPRGNPHACVGLNGHLVFDPHPQDGSGRGLVKVDHYGLFCARLAR